MPICSALCKNGSACHSAVKPGHTACGKHKSQDVVTPIPTCAALWSDGSPCLDNRVEGHELCRFHIRRAQAIRRQENRRQATLVWHEAWTLFWDAGVTATQERVAQAIANHEVAEEMVPWITNNLAQLVRLHPPHPPIVVPVSELHRLSLDTQNVHTGPVNEQTQAGLDLLVETPVETSEISTLVLLESYWSTKDPKSLTAVMKDMKLWYKSVSCRTKNDRLYRRALDGLWARIQLSSAKEDLLQRLWEEALESVKMCCEGHLSRLCNVLCGFDDAFKAPVSVGELLQQRIAAIAVKDIHVHHKVGEAWAVFEELTIPMEDRMAWLEAF